MSASVYPVHVDARLDSHLSRWLWLVKWVLVIPHVVVLAFLWIAFVALTAVAFFAILFTGRYPRPVFDFNVGVLRWSWRVAYYTYGALATDQYPPFTLDEVPDYPAHLTVDYPEHLSRGLVLVKWWLLAIPHYLIVGLLAGSGLYLAWGVGQDDPEQWGWGGGVIGLLAVIAGVVVLFTGRYPKEIFDLVLGLNRWVLRVAAYAGLMTDEYPPFRLDMGGSEPGAHVALPTVAPAAGPAAVAVSGPGVGPAAGAVSAGEVPPAPSTGATGTTGATGATGAGGVAAPPPAVSRTSPWGAGRVVAVVLGALLFLGGAGMLVGGAILGVSSATLRTDDGYLMSPAEGLTTGSYAVTTEPVVIEGAWSDSVPEAMLGELAIRARGTGGEAVFVGVAPSAAAEAFLAGVGHATVVDLRGADPEPVYRESPGGAPQVLPTESDIWVASATGSGEQQLAWVPTTGEWTVVVMNADGGAGVSADLAVGAELPSLGWVVVGLLVVGGLALVLSIVLVAAALYGGRRRA